MDYVLGEKEAHCIFCPQAGGRSDDERLILFRGELSMVMMNRFPYQSGHLLVAPWRHVPDLEGLTDEELLDLSKVLRRSLRALKAEMNPDGFNVGINIGEVAGAGYEAHLHYHVVPRWTGDNNFIAVLGETRVISEHIRASFEKLRVHFERDG
jgi:ATP adenylyltransferase